MAKKIVHLGFLNSFWSTAEAWIKTNFTNLYDNDEEQEKAIDNIKNNQSALETHLEQVERTVANILNEFDIKYNT